MRTKIGSRSVGTFIQPALEGTASVMLLSFIDWVKEGTWLCIQGAGIYEVQSVTGNVCLLKLKSYEIAPGTPVTANNMFPVSKIDQSAYTWGAIEW